MYFKRNIGIFGENAVIKYLVSKGYCILTQNYLTRLGEIDIIAKDKDEIVFIEVKTRRNLNYGTPSEAVDLTKLKHIIRAAKYYLFQTKQENAYVRFDVIEVYLGKSKYVINHIKQIEI